MKVDYQEAADCLKMIAQPVRLMIVDFLSQAPAKVSEIAEFCGIKSNLASEHLKLLKLCGFVEASKEGREVTYCLREPHLLRLLDCVHEKFGVNNASRSKRIKRKA